MGWGVGWGLPRWGREKSYHWATLSPAPPLTQIFQYSKGVLTPALTNQAELCLNTKFYRLLQSVFFMPNLAYLFEFV